MSIRRKRGIAVRRVSGEVFGEKLRIEKINMINAKTGRRSGLG